MVPVYPEFSELTMNLRPELYPLFKSLKEGISEFTFANLYLFRETHQYRICMLSGNILLIVGRDAQKNFFMLPFGLPEKSVLEVLFQKFDSMKCVSEGQASKLAELGYLIEEDRDNFDYLYLRKELATLPGGKFHRKKNLINAFLENYSYIGKPLLNEYMREAVEILEEWRRGRESPGDYAAAREALEKMDELQLCGGIYYVDGKPAAYTLGEELAAGESFVIHFEKAVEYYKGLYQFINQSFAAILPEKYETINREQDLGDDGLRQAKMTYRPVGFIKKFRAFIK